MNNIGLTTEKSMINYINEKKYLRNMNDNIKKFLSSIFDFDVLNHEIKACKFADNYKPDIIITANNVSKYISLKTGNSNSIHQEHLYSFIEFLRNFNISNKAIKTLKYFQFNDKTLDGSGKQRRDANDYIKNHQQEIYELNLFFNNNTVKEALIKKLLFEGEYFHIPSVDYIYYGDIEYGLWASKTEITNYLKSINLFSSSIHTSKLYYQSLHRNLKFDKYYEYRRYYIQFKWYSIKEDLKYILEKRK